MRAGTAEEKATDGCFVARPVEDGTHGEELVESKLAMENVAAGETVGRFKVLRRDDLDAFDEAWKIRGVRGKRANDSGTEFPAAGVPIPFLQFIRRILNAGRENMLAFRSEGRIKNRRNGDIEIGRF